MTEYKHIKFSTATTGLEQAIKEAEPIWQLVNVVPLNPYEAIAVFSREVASLGGQDERF